MDVGYHVLVMNKADSGISFEINAVCGNKIPESINGESGHHICYVRIMTELIVKRLMEVSDKYTIADEDIEKIALAASVHDVGKTHVPQAILEKNESLSPVEYDIVKKHTVFGERLIRESGAVLDPGVLKYACEVARYHHERYDGAGYPDGLAGDDIPIAAQIVSIADAYEALTSDRSYKKALSQDVALAMITNGMCGVFNPLLIDCLMQVVGDKRLADIRSHLMQSKAIYMDPYSQPPKKVLLMGNLRYVTGQFIEETFADARVSIIGNCDISESAKLKIYREEQPNYKAIFDTYEFDFIIYFANELTYDTIDPSDMEQLRQIMKASKYIAHTAKFLYLSSLDGAFVDKNDRGIISAAKENLCVYWAKENDINLKIIRIPYLYNGTAKDDYLNDLFVQMQNGSRVRLRESAGSKIYFLSASDLSDLIIRIVDTWAPGDGVLTINDEFHFTFGDLCAALQKVKGGIQFDFTGKNVPKHLYIKNTAVKKRYSWFAKISILEDLQEQYENYQNTLAPKGSLWDRLRTKLRKYAEIIKVAELFLLFFLCEILLQVTDSALFFSTVDFRLVYIVLMATVYGLPYGMGAAALSSLSWAAAKVISGTNWMTLFYEPTNWLPFIFFFLVGAVCGYVKRRKDDRIRFAEEEKRLLEDKLSFTRQIYEDTFHEKRDLKKQIIGSKDSFGKIFDITRQLNTVDSHELYLKIVSSFENILENKTVSVYSVNEGSVYARLEVASRDLVDKVSRSISLETYAPVMQALKRGEVWRNNNLLPNMPMYACGVYENEKPLLIVFLWNAQMHQRSLYYMNLFRILCDLTQMSLIRARNYSLAMHDKEYIAGTNIQNEEAYHRNLLTFMELAERKVFQFLQVEVAADERPLDELSTLLSKCVRTNDIIGVTQEGKIGILFAQAGPEDLKFILPRFEKLGITVQVLE